MVLPFLHILCVKTSFKKAVRIGFVTVLVKHCKKCYNKKAFYKKLLLLLKLLEIKNLLKLKKY
jgi:hypothetical protein